MKKFYGIGNEGNLSKFNICFFWGLNFIKIVLWTKKYKFIPRFYIYKNYDYNENSFVFINWFFGIALNCA